MADALLQEDGVSKIVLEDASGNVLIEDQPVGGGATELYYTYRRGDGRR